MAFEGVMSQNYPGQINTLTFAPELQQWQQAFIENETLFNGAPWNTARPAFAPAL